MIFFFVKEKVVASTASSTIYSQFVRFPTVKVEPRSLPGKNDE
jgi:hypothetical protein